MCDGAMALRAGWRRTVWALLHRHAMHFCRVKESACLGEFPARSRVGRVRLRALVHVQAGHRKAGFEGTLSLSPPFEREAVGMGTAANRLLYLPVEMQTSPR